MRLTLWLSFLFSLTCTAQEKPFKIEKINGNVYAFITPGPLRDMVEGNSTAIICKNGIMIIDTFGSPWIAELMITELKKISALPVKYILNTHWHYDHVMGNWAWKQAYPEAIILAHKETKRLLDIRIPKAVDSEPAASRDFIDKMMKELKEGKKEDGTSLSIYESKVRYPQTLRDLRLFVEHIDTYKYQSPDVTFTDSLTVYLGTDSVLIFHPGRAHSPGDAMVFLPSNKILITGDEVIHPVPYSFGPFHRGWQKVLQEIIDLNPAVIIPGHGEIQYDLNYVKDQLSLLEALQTAVEDAKRKGLSVEQAQESIMLSDYFTKFTGSDAERKWAFRNYFLNPGVKSLYKQLDGVVPKI